ILTSLKKIATEFGTTESVVRTWIREGAPIVCDGGDTGIRYKAEKAELWEWYKIRKFRCDAQS
ncbi:MAG: hypothetical protein IJU65_03590, partial [Desulfovibrio sp.]|nr:hypothetical protein [Desulfovibrio sp.]